MSIRARRLGPTLADLRRRPAGALHSYPPTTRAVCSSRTMSGQELPVLPTPPKGSPVPRPADEASTASASTSAQTSSIASSSSSSLKPTAASTRSTAPPTRPTRQPAHPSYKLLSKALAYLLRHGAEKEGLTMGPDGFVSVSEILQKNRVKGIEFPLEDQETDTPAPTLQLTVENDQATAPSQSQDVSSSPQKGQKGNKKPPKKKKSTRSPNATDIIQVVEDVAPGEKRRFELSTDPSDGSLSVRAMQGHSLSSVTDLDHTLVQLSNLSVLSLSPPSSTSTKEPDQPIQVDMKLPDGVEILHGTTREAWDAILQSGGLSKMKRNHIHLARGRPGVQGVGSGMRPNSAILIHIELLSALRDGIQFQLASNGAVLTAGLDGVLPLRYISRVEDRQGKVIWRPEGEDKEKVEQRGKEVKVVGEGE